MDAQVVDDVLDKQEDVEELLDIVRFLQRDDENDNIISVGKQVLNVVDFVGRVSVLGFLPEDQNGVFDGWVRESGDFGVRELVNVIGVRRNHGDLIEMHIEGMCQRSVPFRGGQEDDISVNEIASDMLGQLRTIVGECEARHQFLEDVLIIGGEDTQFVEDVEEDGEVLGQMEEGIFSISSGDLVKDHGDVVSFGEIDEVASAGKEDDIVGIFDDLFVCEDGFDRISTVRGQYYEGFSTTKLLHVSPVLEIIIVGNIDVGELPGIDLKVSLRSMLLLLELDL